MSVQKSEFVWLDGSLVPHDQAKVDLLTHTLHYGLGAFEGTRAYEQSAGGTAVFRLDDHLRRLERSAKILQIDMTYDRETLTRASLEMIEASGFSSCYLRHLVFLGHGSMGVFPRDNPVRTSITTWRWGAYLGEEGLREGIRCQVSSYTRSFPNASMTKAKATGGYIGSILAKREAIAHGYDEAILLDMRGCVAEGTGENLFAVRDKIVMTPPLTMVLAGITRETIMCLAAEMGYEVRETLLTRDELYGADEVFLTGTAAEVTPVREIDRRTIGTGRAGKITLELQEAFFRVVRGESPQHAEWLTPVATREATVKVV